MTMSQLSVIPTIWGGEDIKSQTCNNIVCRIYDFYAKNEQWIAVAHIPDTINIEADKESGALEDATEWKLNPALFHKIVE